MKTPQIIAVLAIICASAQAQITAIQSSSSLGGLGPVTTIAPLGNGYSYATVGGPNNGWGSVQVSPGSSVSMGVTPRGGIMPIVTPSAPRIEPMAMPVSYPEYVPIPSQHPQEYIFPQMTKGFYTWSQETFGYKKGQKITNQDKIRAIESYVIYLENNLPNRRAAASYPQSKADAEKKEFQDLFAKIAFKSDREKFWKDFYADWHVAPQTPIPLANMIPYLKLWLRSNLESVPKT